MSHSTSQITCQDAQQMALRALVPLHLAGCAVVVGLCCAFSSVELSLLCVSFLLLTVPVPQAAAKVLGAVAYELFHRTTLPIVVFIRISAILLDLTLFIWLLTFLDCFHWMP